jgi:protein involved in polysaccharide export with SLBB domain
LSQHSPEALPQQQKTVKIEGFVQHPGVYRWYEGMTIGDLLTDAGGPTGFAGRVCLERGRDSVAYELPKPSDALWSGPVLEGETIRVLHKVSLEYDTH